ncbi:MAG: hypothetical protein ACFBZ8_00075 [Opitutales bacterium]
MTGCGEQSDPRQPDLAPDDLDFPTLARDYPLLWPLQVKLLEPHAIHTSSGRHIRDVAAGEIMGLAEVYPDVLVLLDYQTSRAFNCPPNKTDIVERARLILLAGVPTDGRVTRALNERVVRFDGAMERKLVQAPLRGAKAILLVHADATRSEDFSAIQQLLGVYPRWKETYPAFELLYVGHEPRQVLHENVTRNLEMPWLIANDRSNAHDAVVLSHDAISLPALILVSEQGETLATSVPWNGDPLPVADAIELMDRELDRFFAVKN